MKLVRFLTYSTLGIVLLACSTEKNTLVNRGFHNVHAKYNGYFNANEIIKLTYDEFLNSRKENYNKLLPIYPLPNVEQSKNWYAPMDTAAGKCELVIYRHRMPHEKKGRNRNKEWCKWIDNNWITIAKTKFYKKKFGQSLKIFQYVENHFPTEDGYYESIFWQAKVLIEMEAFDEAEEVLLNLVNKYEEKLKESPNKNEDKKLNSIEKVKLFFNYEERQDYLESIETEIPFEVINQVYPTLADLYLKDNRNEQAIEYLEKTIAKKHKKEFKTRLIYILAQLYHMDENYKASTYYQQVVERNPDYEMAFQAKINRALSFSGGDSKAVKLQLLKMLKDDKNIDYFDQIYYALAEISFKENKESLAIEQLQNSINLSKGNKDQKVKSMKKMGDWHYAKTDYISAYHCYDSLRKLISKTTLQKEVIEKNTKLLTKIYDNLNTIELNDSIIRLCSLDPEERVKKIFEVMDALELQRQKENENNLLASNSNSLSVPGPNSSINTSIFFWDQAQLTRGKKEFDKKWGSRKLEDNWRRSSKASAILIEEETFTVNNNEDNVLFEKIMNDLPCDDPEKKKIMNDSTLISLFNLGIIHHYETGNLSLAKRYFKRILANYQPAPQAIAAAYELYRIHETENNKAEQKEMKDLLVKNYPRSKYTKMIMGGDDLTSTEKDIIKEKQIYLETYELYKSGEYQGVKDFCSEKIKDSLNPLFCEYGLLMAYSQGKLSNNVDSVEIDLIATLKTITKNCLGSAQGEQAINILKELKISSSNKSKQNEKWSFSYSPDTIHYFVLYLPKGEFNVNNTKNKVADFNMSSFSSKSLKTSSQFLNTSDQMVMVKFFTTADEALDYHLSFKVNKGPLKEYAKADFFVITPNNLKELILEKNINNYTKFFQKYYL